MTPQDADPREITGIRDASRRDQASKANWHVAPIGEPPMTEFEIRDGRRIEECKTVDLGQDISDILFLSVDSPNAIHSAQPSRCVLADLDEPARRTQSVLMSRLLSQHDLEA